MRENILTYNSAHNYCLKSYFTERLSRSSPAATEYYWHLAYTMLASTHDTLRLSSSATETQSSSNGAACTWKAFRVAPGCAADIRAGRRQR